MPRQKLTLDECLQHADEVQKQEAVEAATDMLLPELDKPGTYHIKVGRLNTTIPLRIDDDTDDLYNHVLTTLENAYDALCQTRNSYTVATNMRKSVIDDYEEE